VPRLDDLVRVPFLTEDPARRAATGALTDLMHKVNRTYVKAVVTIAKCLSLVLVMGLASRREIVTPH
jgi:hypothetical protein